MSSHANCTHEKTKAARAACRAGKGVGPSVGPKPAAAADRLREKAAGGSSKLGEPKAEGVSLGRTAAMHAYVSGHCAHNNHDRCAGVYGSTACTCACHYAPHAE